LLSVVVVLGLLVVGGYGRAPLLHADSTTLVEGEYIVVLRPEISVRALRAHVLDLHARFAQSTGDNALLYMGGFDIGDFKGFAARLAPDMLEREFEHPDVLYIEVNQVVRASACVVQNSVLWNLDRISERTLDLDGQYDYPSSAGSGVTVFIVDTGIQTDNVDFEGRARSGFTVDGSHVDGNGHGTHVASTVGGKQYGVAKAVELIAVKVLGTDGSGTTAGVISGIDYVTKNKKKTNVANMSLGGGKSTSLDNAVASSIASGVTYAVAAGNEDQSACNVSPANVPTAITVGATDSSDSRSSFSNWGTCVDIFAPGTTITAAWIGSKTAIRTISGTSMASPHVAGAAALLLSLEPNLTPAQVTIKLNSASSVNFLKNVKTGSPNRLLFTAHCKEQEITIQ